MSKQYTATLTLKIDDGRLEVVPAVHFHVTFADVINRCCCDPAQRPAAIAVELGPIMTFAVQQWLQELGIGPAKRQRLPVMLGLIKQNRLVKPSLREKVIELQRQSGLPLSALPAKVLQDTLGYIPFSTLLLSPTDSIIEAIRCGCELAIPVYGVDLDEMAEPDYPHALIADPNITHEQLAAYINDNQSLVQASSDPEIDSRRELAIAARLKTLMQRYERVLFTCGLAHWQRISQRLNDPALRPAVVEPTTSYHPDVSQLKRVVIDPRLGCSYLDRFPLVARCYERQRRHPSLGGAPARGLPDLHSLHQRVLRKTYRQYFFSDHSTWQETKQQDWERVLVFEQMLQGQTQLNLRTLPTIADFYQTSQSLMSSHFCQALGQSLLDFPWVQPGEPGLGLTASLEPTESTATTQGVRLNQSDKDIGDTIPFQLVAGQGGRYLPQKALPLRPSPHRQRQTKLLSLKQFAFYYSWLPWDNLVNALSAQAVAFTGKRTPAPIVEEFNGQLLDGIAIKATLHAQAKGINTLFVRNTYWQQGVAAPDPTKQFPVVWLFDCDAQRNNDNHIYYGLNLQRIARYAKEPALTQQFCQEQGTAGVALLFGQHNSDVTFQQLVQQVDFRGLVLYMPFFPGDYQFMRWFEQTSFQGNPFDSFGFSEFDQTINQDLAQHGFDVGCLSWQDWLVCAAIPYGSKTITVVSPPALRLAKTVTQYAACHGKRIRLVSVERFAPHQVQRLRKNHMARGRFDTASDQVIYHPEVEHILNEPPDRYLQLIPDSWRTFGFT